MTSHSGTVDDERLREIVAESEEAVDYLKGWPQFNGVQERLFMARELLALRAAPSRPVEAGELVPVAWMHEILEPDTERPLRMYSGASANPWSRWMADHLEKCAYTCTPLYAAAAPTSPQLERERDEWKAACMQAREGCNQRSEVIRKLRVKLEEAEKALGPFAATAEVDIGESESDDDIFQQASHNRAPKITVGDFRRALEAYPPRRARSTLKGEA